MEGITFEFELHYGSYSVSDIQEYFEYIIKKHETVSDDSSIMIYVNKIENRITFKIKTRYYLELFNARNNKNTIKQYKQSLNQ